MLFVASVSSSAQAKGPTVRLAQGAAEGIAEGAGVDAVLGLPYAAPPVGDLRWRAPAAAARWKGVRAATHFGSACPQPSGGAMRIPEPRDEDCLTANVWRPSGAHGAPVLVWIHGGGFESGGGSWRQATGEAFARDGVVTVTFNYRLGALGFFAHPALDRQSGAPNFGLLDQIAALNWVRDNIARFGGDPRRVTIAGQSAGARAVLMLMTSPPARGLFRAAIVESAFEMEDLPDIAAAERFGEAVAARAGLSPADQTPAALRALPADALVKAYREAPGAAHARPVVVRDGWLVQATPDPVFAKAREAPVPLIIGANSRETSVMDGFGLTPRAVAARFGGLDGALASAYGPVAQEAARYGEQLFTDVWIQAPSRRLAREHARRAPTWTYVFDHPYDRWPEAALGAPHGFEVAYVFDRFDAEPTIAAFATPRDRRIARALHACWVNFIRDGSPAGGSCRDWPGLDRAATPTLVVGDDLRIDGAFHRRRLDAIDALEPIDRGPAR